MSRETLHPLLKDEVTTFQDLDGTELCPHVLPPETTPCLSTRGHQNICFVCIKQIYFCFKSLRFSNLSSSWWIINHLSDNRSSFLSHWKEVEIFFDAPVIKRTMIGSIFFLTKLSSRMEKLSNVLLWGQQVHISKSDGLRRTELCKIFNFFILLDECRNTFYLLLPENKLFSDRILTKIFYCYPHLWTALMSGFLWLIC